MVVAAVVGNLEEKAVAASQLLSDPRPELLSHWGPGFSENPSLAVNKAKVASFPVNYIVTISKF